MAEKTTDKSPDLLRIERAISEIRSDILHMQRMGGFTDSKTHSMRATRIEGRVEILEQSIDVLLDAAAFTSAMMENHLEDRHDCDLAHDDAGDVLNWRRIRHRLRKWAEAKGLMQKKRDSNEVRQSENRVRPMRVSA